MLVYSWCIWGVLSFWIMHHLQLPRAPKDIFFATSISQSLIDLEPCTRSYFWANVLYFMIQSQKITHDTHKKSITYDKDNIVIDTFLFSLYTCLLTYYYKVNHWFYSCNLYFIQKPIKFPFQIYIVLYTLWNLNGR